MILDCRDNNQKNLFQKSENLIKKDPFNMDFLQIYLIVNNKENTQAFEKIFIKKGTLFKRYLIQ